MGNCPVLNFNWENDQSPHNFLRFPNGNPPREVLLQYSADETKSKQAKLPSHAESSSEYESFSEDEGDDQYQESRTRTNSRDYGVKSNSGK